MPNRKKSEHKPHNPMLALTTNAKYRREMSRLITHGWKEQEMKSGIIPMTFSHPDHPGGNLYLLQASLRDRKHEVVLVEEDDIRPRERIATDVWRIYVPRSADPKTLADLKIGPIPEDVLKDLIASKRSGGKGFAYVWTPAKYAQGKDATEGTEDTVVRRYSGKPSQFAMIDAAEHLGKSMGAIKNHVHNTRKLVPDSRMGNKGIILFYETTLIEWYANQRFGGFKEEAPDLPRQEMADKLYRTNSERIQNLLLYGMIQNKIDPNQVRAAIANSNWDGTQPAAWDLVALAEAARDALPKRQLTEFVLPAEVPENTNGAGVS